ncbi:MAG TPA: hypothetical protein VI685_19645 [Candidatus Angelobacter sp.]
MLTLTTPESAQIPQPMFERGAAPWETDPYGLVTLLDMLKFAANDFVWTMHELMVFCASPQLISSEAGALRVVTSLDISQRLCEKLSLSSAIRQHARIRQTIAEGGGSIAPDLLRSLVEELVRRLQEDLAERNFLMMPAEKVKYLDDLWLAAQPLESAFPNAQEELRNAARCYAFAQEMASVFHSMRALEIGLKALADSLAAAKKPNWQDLINDIEAEIKKINGPHAGPDWKQKQKFYSEAATNFRYFKNAWRNHVMHVRDKYSERDAKQIMEHVVSFLNILAEGGVHA